MLFTADHRPSDLSDCEALGIAGWAVKPIGPAVLDDLLSSQPSEQCEVREPIEPLGRPLNVLLVDDRLENRQLILAFLRDTHHVVECAEDGRVAVERFKEGDYDLVLMDVQMPEMDGYSATKAIRAWAGAPAAPRRVRVGGPGRGEAGSRHRGPRGPRSSRIDERKSPRCGPRSSGLTSSG
jgi:DNA-binding NarL/FixJ family response regulator